MALVNIEYKYSTKHKRYHINKYNKTLNGYRAWVKQNIPSNLVIQNDDDAKTLKNKRTIVRKEIAELKGIRKAVNQILMGEFDAQTDEILDLLEPIDTGIKKLLDDYKAQKEAEAKVEEAPVEAEEVYTINYSTKNKDHYDKIMALINELEGTNNG